jgi:hypothetical protein
VLTVSAALAPHDGAAVDQGEYLLRTTLNAVPQANPGSTPI